MFAGVQDNGSIGKCLCEVAGLAQAEGLCAQGSAHTPSLCAYVHASPSGTKTVLVCVPHATIAVSLTSIECVIDYFSTLICWNFNVAIEQSTEQ
eukprot:scaffold143207_cov18-Tisochrysis_lutea.AAC.1